MKSLQTIQKVFHVFRILTQIAMVLTFIWAGLSALGLLFVIILHFGGNIAGTDTSWLFNMTGTENTAQVMGILINETVLALTNGALLTYTLRYFRTEEKDGTPFTKRGADEIMRLGLLNIALPIVTAIAVAIISAIFAVPKGSVSDWSNLDSLTVGIFMILASLIFRYGADLEGDNGNSDIFENFRR